MSEAKHTAALTGDAIRALLRSLLWDEHQECCGQPVVGAEYMGQQELVCCGCPDRNLLNDAQIVATLRARFPDDRCTSCEGSGSAGVTGCTDCLGTGVDSMSDTALAGPADVGGNHGA